MSRYFYINDYIFDVETGLQWTIKIEGPITWIAAMDHVSKMQDGWKMPTITQLSGLTPQVLNIDSKKFWSSTLNNENGVYIRDFSAVENQVRSAFTDGYANLICVRKSELKITVHNCMSCPFYMFIPKMNCAQIRICNHPFSTNETKITCPEQKPRNCPLHHGALTLEMKQA